MICHSSKVDKSLLLFLPHSQKFLTDSKLIYVFKKFLFSCEELILIGDIISVFVNLELVLR
jgi:hypothetical protein